MELVQVTLRSHTPGKSIRLSRLFHDASGRSVIVALDHGQDRGILPGLERLEPVIADLVEAAPDALLLRASTLKRFHRHLQGKGAPALIVAVDGRWTETVVGGGSVGEEYRALVSVEEAAALGADAVKCLLIFGRKDLRVHAANIEAVGRLIERSERVGIPVMVEATLWGEAIPPERENDPELIPHIARVAFELGADLLKLPYAGGIFREIVQALPVPITILGGAKVGSQDAFHAMIREAVADGVHGVALGRNVWQAESPQAEVAKLKAIVHGS